MTINDECMSTDKHERKLTIIDIPEGTEIRIYTDQDYKLTGIIGPKEFDNENNTAYYDLWLPPGNYVNAEKEETK